MHLNWPLFISLLALSKPIWDALHAIYLRIFTSGRKEQMTVAQAREFLAKLDSIKREMHDLNRARKEDIQELFEAISTNNDMANDRHHEFYAEFVRLQVKVAAFTGDSNGGHDN